MENVSIWKREVEWVNKKMSREREKREYVKEREILSERTLENKRQMKKDSV